MLLSLPKRAFVKGLRVTARQLDRLASAVSSRPVLLPAERRLLQANRPLEGLHRGRRAFVVGNGPSLNALDLTRLREEIVLTCNGFACHPILDTWQPLGLCLADPAYFAKPEAFQGEFERIRRRMTTTRFFVPLEGRRVIRAYGLLPEERVSYCCLHSNMIFYRSFPVDLTRPLPAGQTVTQFAIAVALYMGCNPIYLIGMDHDFLAQPKKATHFSEAYEAGQDGEPIENYTSWTYLRLIRAVGSMFEGHANLRNVAEARGQKILNASAGGFLDVYPRVEFRDLF